MIGGASDDENRVESLAAEFAAHRRRGEHPSIAEYAERHPELADEIRAFFPAVALVEELKPASDDVTGSFAGPELFGADAPPERLGDFRIVREIGRGGMGVVYQAEQESLGRFVALKVLGSSTLLDPQKRQRFQREARAAATCTIPTSCRSLASARKKGCITTSCSSSPARAWTRCWPS